jgi:Protein of unknown function (DUF669)
MADGVNWAELQQLAADSGFVDAPKGTWEMEITKAEHKLSGESTGKKDMYVVTFKIVSGPHQGATQRHNFTISPDSPGAIGIFLRYMNALGMGPEYQATNPKHEQVVKDLVGRRAMVTIGDNRNEPARTAVTNIAAVPGATPVTRSTGADADDPFAVFKEDQTASPADAPPTLPF